MGISKLQLKRTPKQRIKLAALVSDLKQRGLLEDTIVIWGGNLEEPQWYKVAMMVEIITTELSASGWQVVEFEEGTHGETDELVNVAKDPVHVHDLNATLLHLLGMDHERSRIVSRKGFSINGCSR